LGSILDAREGFAFGSTADAPLVYWIVRSESHCPWFSLRNVFIITTAGAAAVYRMQRLSKPREQHLHPHIGQSEVHQKALAATFLCALAIALYLSTTFAVHRTYSSQSAHCRKQTRYPEIEIMAVVSFLLFFPLSIAFFLQSMCFGLLTNLDLMIIVISSAANPKSVDNLCKMQYLIICPLQAQLRWHMHSLPHKSNRVWLHIFLFHCQNSSSAF